MYFCLSLNFATVRYRLRSTPKNTPFFI